MSFRFVVVDDAAFLREVIKNTITQMGGVCVGEASDGGEAVAVVAQALPDLVTLDLVMPRANGLQIAGQLKDLHPEIKILACTTLDEEIYRDKALAAGIDDFLMKPFSKEDLLEKISKLIVKEG